MNESPLAWRLHEKSRKIEDGIVSDPKFYGRIYGAAKEDDPADPATWIKANPSLKQNGGFLDIEKIREKYVSHEAEGYLTSFKRYYLNMWDQKESRAIDMVKWDASAGDWQATGLLREATRGKGAPVVSRPDGPLSETAVLGWGRSVDDDGPFRGLAGVPR